jgi:hypothetical protein
MEEGRKGRRKERWGQGLGLMELEPEPGLNLG